MGVHSTRLGANNGVPVGGATIYTVPANRRTILKSLQLLNLAAVTNRIVIHVGISAGGSYEWVYTLGALTTASESVNQEMWCVLHAGDTLQIRPQSGVCEASASGAELTV